MRFEICKKWSRNTFEYAYVSYLTLEYLRVSSAGLVSGQQYHVRPPITPAVDPLCRFHSRPRSELLFMAVYPENATYLTALVSRNVAS